MRSRSRARTVRRRRQRVLLHRLAVLQPRGLAEAGASGLRPRTRCQATCPRCFSGARAATEPKHPIPGHSPDACTAQLGVAGRWHERLPHFRFDRTPSSGEAGPSERVPDPARRHRARDHGPLHDGRSPRRRTRRSGLIAADDDSRSLAFERASASIHFTWRRDSPVVAAVLPDVEAGARTVRAAAALGEAVRDGRRDAPERYRRLPRLRGHWRRHQQHSLHLRRRLCRPRHDELHQVGIGFTSEVRDLNTRPHGSDLFHDVEPEDLIKIRA